MDFPGIDPQKMIEKYQNVTAKLYDLQDGSGIVVGQEVDANNMLVYVIRSNNQLTLMYAADCTIINFIHPTVQHKTVINTGQS